jgi:isopentenyl-diphosphate delta-isomerase
MSYSADVSEPPKEPPRISRRKADHIEVAASGAADFRARTTMLEQVHLVHQALPELAASEVDLRTELCGNMLAAPIVVSGMTGGTDEAAQINRDLARAAQKLGIAFGVGSQRAMAEHPELEPSFRVRDVAPDLFLIGNLGAVQARAFGVPRVAALVKSIGASAIAIHLNPAMEMVQEEGDRDFRGALATIGELCAALDVPVVVKETGCGLSREVARAVVKVGVTAVDVSGAGGTSWVAVEARRAGEASSARALGEELWDWGIPTAVSVALCAAEKLEVIATGGLRSGLDVARAIALGARCGGLAAPVLRAQRAAGYQGALDFLEQVIRSLRTVTLLCGCPRVADLARVPRHIGADLAGWLRDLGL